MSHGKHAARGLTLLELVLSLLLMSVILGLAWSLLGIFRDRLERGQQQTEEAQLIRSLQQVLANDLRTCQVDLRPDDQRSTAMASGTAAETSGQPDDLSARQSTPTVSADPDSASVDSVGASTASPSSVNANPTEPPDVGTTADDAPPSVGSAVSTAEADRIVIDTWLIADSFLMGTSQAIVFDVLPPVSPPGPQPPMEQPALDSATIPDTFRRVVYAFYNPADALRLDRPPGLLRCELTQRQLAEFRQLETTGADLLTLLRPALEPLLAESSQRPLAPPPESINRTDAAGLPSAPSTPRASESTTDALGRESLADLQLDKYLDYVPELATWQLRYFDGLAWRSEWDSRVEGKLPVAVELRFQLASEIPAPSALDDDSIPSDAPLPRETAAPETISPVDAGPLDDAYHSAQTRPPDDHRFLIFLRAAGTQPSDFPLGDGATESEPAATDIPSDEVVEP